MKSYSKDSVRTQEFSSRPFIRPLPSNVDAEVAIVGTLLSDNSVLSRIKFLEPKHFFRNDYAYLYEAICAIVDGGGLADPITIKPLVESAVEALGVENTSRWLLMISESIAAPSNVESYAKLVVDLWQRREMIEVGEALVNRAYDCEDLDPATKFAHDAIEELSQLNGYGWGWVPVSEIEPKNIEFLWPNRFIKNRINIIAGMGDVGKDVFCCTVAAHVTTGADWPDGQPGCTPGNVGIISPEDDPNDTIVPRLLAAGGNPQRLRVWRGLKSPLPDDMRGLSALVVSPLISLLPSDKNMNNEQDIRQFLARWQEGGECTIIGTAHLNKKNDLNIVQRIMGASGLVNFVRSSWSIQRDDEDQTVRLFMRLKANLSPDETSGLKYRIEHVGEFSQSIACVWCGTTDKSPDEVQHAVASSNGRKPAGKWLVSYLERHGGIAQANVIIEAGEKEGYSKDAIQKAQKRDTRILSYKKGYGTDSSWWWQLSQLEESVRVDGL